MNKKSKLFVDGKWIGNLTDMDKLNKKVLQLSKKYNFNPSDFSFNAYLNIIIKDRIQIPYNAIEECYCFSKKLIGEDLFCEWAFWEPILLNIKLPEDVLINIINLKAFYPEKIILSLQEMTSGVIEAFWKCEHISQRYKMMLDAFLKRFTEQEYFSLLTPTLKALHAKLFENLPLGKEE